MKFGRFDLPVLIASSVSRELNGDETSASDGKPHGHPASRRRLFVSLCSIVFLVNLARVVFAPLVDPFIDAFGMSEATVGLIVTLVWIGSATPRFPTGYLLTIIPRHRVVLWTGLVLTASSVFIAFANSVLTLAIGAFLMGTASGAYFIAALPLVSELYPERVGRAVGIHGTASQVAAVVAPLFVGGVLFVASWRLVFVLLSLAAFSATAVLYRTAKDTSLPDAGSEDRHFFRAIRNQWPIIVSGIAIVGATGFVWNGFFNFFIRYLTVEKAIAETTAQTLLTVIFAAGVPAFWLTGSLADRVPHIPLLLAILTGFIVCLIGVTVAGSLLTVALFTAALGYVIHSLFPAVDTYLLGSLPDENRASAYATFSAAAMIMQATGSWGVGLLREEGLTFTRIFQSLSVMLVAVLLLLVALHVAGRLPTEASSPDRAD